MEKWAVLVAVGAITGLGILAGWLSARAQALRRRVDLERELAKETQRGEKRLTGLDPPPSDPQDLLRRVERQLAEMEDK